MRYIWCAGSIIAATIAVRLMWHPGSLGRSNTVWAIIAVAVVISMAMGVVGVRRGGASAIISILAWLMSVFTLLVMYTNTGPYRGQ